MRRRRLLPAFGIAEPVGDVTERPKWMVRAAILLILGVPAITQLLMHWLPHNDLYYWGWAMFTN